MDSERDFSYQTCSSLNVCQLSVCQHLFANIYQTNQSRQESSLAAKSKTGFKFAQMYIGEISSHGEIVNKEMKIGSCRNH